MKDPIIEEIREIRRKIEAENNNDFKQLFQKISVSHGVPPFYVPHSTK